jgi:biopolymer transport protein ExbD
MSRNRRKLGNLPLTSLMDVFTILVFFLLVNSGSVEIVEAPKSVTLPESKAEAKPRETVVIFVSEEEILVQGKAVARVSEVLEADRGALEAITDRLEEVSGRIIGPATMAVATTDEVTIMADRQVPFAVIKRIMSACTGHGYEQVSLAVIQKVAEEAQAG